MYKVITTEYGVVIEATDSSGFVWYIPQDAENTDYKNYLTWLEQNNGEVPVVE